MRKKFVPQALPVTVWSTAGLPIVPAGGGVAPVANWRKGPTSPVKASWNCRATRPVSRVKLITPSELAWRVSTP